MKKAMLLVVMLVAFGVVGCDEDKITPEQFQELAGGVQQLTEKVDDYQDAGNEVIGTLEAYGLTNPEIVEKARKINAEIDRVQPQVDPIIAAVKDTPLSGDDATDWIRIIQTTNKASLPWNPYAPYIEAGLTLSTIFLSYLLKKKASEAKEYKGKYQAHKQGTARTSIELEKPQQKLLYDNIGGARIALGVK